MLIEGGDYIYIYIYMHIYCGQREHRCRESIDGGRPPGQRKNKDKTHRNKQMMIIAMILINETQKKQTHETTKQLIAYNACRTAVHNIHTCIHNIHTCIHILINYEYFIYIYIYILDIKTYIYIYIY